MGELVTTGDDKVPRRGDWLLVELVTGRAMCYRVGDKRCDMRCGDGVTSDVGW